MLEKYILNKKYTKSQKVKNKEKIFKTLAESETKVKVLKNEFFCAEILFSFYILGHIGQTSKVDWSGNLIKKRKFVNFNAHIKI